RNALRLGRGSVIDGNVGGRVVHVVLDAFTRHNRQARRAVRDLDVRAEVDSPTRRVTRKLGGGRVRVGPVDRAQDSGALDVAPWLRHSVLGRDVRQREAPDDALLLDAV